MSVSAYKFKEYVYDRYKPFYDTYKGHLFTIDHTSKEDEGHVWLECMTDCDISVSGYVHLEDLEKIEIDPEEILCQLLDNEVWKEIQAETGETKADYDNKIIEAIKSIKNELDTNKEDKSQDNQDAK